MHRATSRTAMTVDEGLPRLGTPPLASLDLALTELAESAVTPPPPASPQDALAVRDMVARLTAAWPGVARTTVESLVVSGFDVFRHVKVRAYVPILVERRVRRSLGAISGATPSGPHDAEQGK